MGQGMIVEDEQTERLQPDQSPDEASVFERLRSAFRPAERYVGAELSHICVIRRTLTHSSDARVIRQGEFEMLDPLQMYAYLKTQNSLRNEFGPAPTGLWHESADVEAKHRLLASERFAGWLREIADRLEPANRSTPARTRA